MRAAEIRLPNMGNINTVSVEGVTTAQVTGFRELGVFHFVGHVGDLQLRWEVSQGTHQVRDLFHRDHTI